MLLPSLDGVPTDSKSWCCPHGSPFYHHPNSPGFDNCKIGGNGATESRRHSSPPLSSSHFIFEFTEKGIQTTAKPTPLPPLLVFESPFQGIQKGKESRKGKNVINHFFLLGFKPDWRRIQLQQGPKEPTLQMGSSMGPGR